MPRFICRPNTRPHKKSRPRRTSIGMFNIRFTSSTSAVVAVHGGRVATYRSGDLYDCATGIGRTGPFPISRFLPTARPLSEKTGRAGASPLTPAPPPRRRLAVDRSPRPSDLRGPSGPFERLTHLLDGWSLVGENLELQGRLADEQFDTCHYLAALESRFFNEQRLFGIVDGVKDNPISSQLSAGIGNLVHIRVHADRSAVDENVDFDRSSGYPIPRRGNRWIGPVPGRWRGFAKR